MKKILIATVLASAFSSYMAVADNTTPPAVDTSGKFVLAKTWTNTVSFSKPLAVDGEVNTGGMAAGAYTTDSKDVVLLQGMLNSDNGTVYVSAPNNALDFNTSDKSWSVGLPVPGIHGSPTTYSNLIKVAFSNVGDSVEGRRIYDNVPSYPLTDPNGLFYVKAKDLSNAKPGANYSITIGSAVWVNN